MAQNTIEILIKATDQASDAISAAAKNVGSSFTGLGKSVLKVGAIAGAAGLTGLVGTMGYLVKGEMEMESAMAELDAVLKSTGGVAGWTADEAEKLALAYQKTTRFADDQVISAQSMLLTFTQIGSDVFPEATEATLNLAEKFGSIDQAATMLGKALNDPVQGVSALRRVGVMLTDEQERQIQKFMEVGDIASAQKVILGELETEFGGLAEAMGNTTQGKIVRFQHLLENAAGSIVGLVMPIIGKLLDKLLGIVPKIESFSGAIARVIQVVTKFGMDSSQASGMFMWAFGPRMGKTLYRIVETIGDVVDVLKDFGRAIAEFVSDHSKAFVAALAAIGAILAGAAIVAGIASIGGAIAMLANPITLIIGAVALLAAAWAEDWGGIRTFVTDKVWPLVEPIFTDIKDWLEVTIPAAIDTLQTAFENLKSAFETGGIGAVGQMIADSLENGLPEMAAWVDEHIVTPVIDKLTGTDWNAVGNTLLALLDKFLGVAGAGIVDAGEWAYEHIVTPVIDRLAAVDWAAVGSKLEDLLGRFLGFAGRGVASMGEWIYQKIITPTITALGEVDWGEVGSKLEDLLEKFLSFAGRGVSSMGEWIYQKIIEPTIQKLSEVDWAAVGSKLLDLLEKFLGAAGAGIADVGSWAYENIIQPVVDKLTDGATYSSLFDAALNAGQAIFDAIIDALGDLPNKLIQLINDAIPNQVTFGSVHIPDMGPLGGGYDVEISMDIPDNPIPLIPGLATGGIVTRPTLAMLAENSRPEAVVPLSRLGSMGGGDVVNNWTVNVYGVQDARQLLDDLEREARRRNRQLTFGFSGAG